MIIDELYALLGYKVEGEKELARFNKSLDKAEKNARDAAKRINALKSSFRGWSSNIRSVATEWQRLNRSMASGNTKSIVDIASKAKQANSAVQQLGANWRKTMGSFREAAVLRIEMKGEKNFDRFKEGLDGAEKRAHQTSSAIESLRSTLSTATAPVNDFKTAWDNLRTSVEKPLAITTASPLTQISNQANTARDSINTLHNRWREAMSDMRDRVKSSVVDNVVDNAIYGGVNTLKAGVVANAEIMREKSRWKDANIPDSERDAAFTAADKLTTQYPSAGFLNVLELARKSRTMMGDNERGLQILPDIVRAFVALQKAKGIDETGAVRELEGFIKGADVAGLNKAGPEGISSFREVLEGWVRAAQVEGTDLDAGKFVQFARMGKTAVPGLSNEFLSTTVPAIAQDFDPSRMGNALAMAFKSFVTGSNSQAGKKNLQAQRDLGIRVGEGKGNLVNDQLFGTDPYQWVKDELIPRMNKQGYDTKDNVAVSKLMNNLVANSNAATIIERMITQQPQIDRNREMYRASKGLDAADTALADDPFVAAKGFTESLRELAAAVKGMPEVVGGLNTLTAGIQSFATSLRESDGAAQALAAGGGIAGVIAAFKAGKGVFDLATAGTSLKEAAFELKGAAAAMRGDKSAQGKNPTKSTDAWGFLGPIGTVLNMVTSALSGPGTKEEFQKNRVDVTKGDQRLNNAIEDLGLVPSTWGGRRGDLYRHATDEYEKRRKMEQNVLPLTGNTPGLKSTLDNVRAVQSNYRGNMSKMDGAQASQTVVNDNSNRSITVNPSVSVSVQQIQEAGAKTAEATKTAVDGALKNVPRVANRASF